MSDTLRLGSRATVATLLKKLDDATVGNKDGVVNNEDRSAGDAARPGAFDKDPMLFKLRAFFEVGLSKHDEEERLGAFLAAAEKEWGAPVTTAAKPAHVSQEDWNTHLVDKAITLVRLGRRPEEVTDGFIRASGSVNGEKIAPREIFVQRWKPTAPSNGSTVVISPGFLETGRNYVEQIQLLNARGYEVVVMDHQWAGLSSGKRGGIDRGFGITRDLAAVVADAAQGGRHVVVAGTSMGGGAGAGGVMLMQALGELQIDGPRTPKYFDVVGQDPFFGRTSSVLNAVLAGTGHVPLVNQIPLPAMGAPVLSRDEATLRKIAAHATTEHLSGRAQAFHASTDDLATMRAYLEQGGVKMKGRMEIIHARHDTLADYETTKQWAQLFGARLTTIESDSHVIEENPAEQGLLLDALERLR